MMERLDRVSFLRSSKHLLLRITIFSLLFSLACSSKPPQQSRTPPTERPSTQTSAPQAGGLPSWLAPDEDGQWTMPAKNYASTRFSGLSEINTENVKNLKVAWTFSTGVNRGQEAAPIVAGGTMYVVTPYPNILYALDLKNQGAMK